MDLTISFVNWNTAKDLQLALEQILRSHLDISYEIIVVDNASTDDSVKRVEEQFPNLILIKNQQNLGFGAGHNQAFQKGTGKYRLILNPDCFVSADSIQNLINFAEQNPTAGIIGPKLLNPNNTLQFSCRRFPSIFAAIFRNALFDKLFPKNRIINEYLMRNWDHDAACEVDWVSGAALLIRGDLLDKIGGFDERFYMYCEDMDLCKRAWDNGYKVMYCPYSTITHAIGHSSDHAPNKMARQHHKSMYLYYKKHLASATPWWIKPLVPLAIFVRREATVLRNHWNIAKRKLKGEPFP